MRQCRKSRKILHYMFGVPPVRAGGMVRYASDLMVQQRRTGDQVYLLLPGALPMDTGKKTKIYRRKADYLGIPAYVIYNPLPVAVCNGILDTAAYTAPCNGNAFSRFLQKLQPDIVHIHTFMGLHREFLAEARRFNIPVIFTSHDYFVHDGSAHVRRTSLHRYRMAYLCAVLQGSVSKVEALDGAGGMVRAPSKKGQACSADKIRDMQKQPQDRQ